MILKWYKPDYIFSKTINITPAFLKERNIKCIFLDADGTLRRHKKLEAADGVMDWIELMQKNGIKLFITSNNFRSKVQPFADIVKLPCVTFSAKPTPWGFIRARLKTKVPLKNTLVVGDQIFTDVLGSQSWPLVLTAHCPYTSYMWRREDRSRARGLHSVEVF